MGKCRAKAEGCFCHGSPPLFIRPFELCVLESSAHKLRHPYRVKHLLFGEGLEQLFTVLGMGGTDAFFVAQPSTGVGKYHVSDTGAILIDKAAHQARSPRREYRSASGCRILALVHRYIFPAFRAYSVVFHKHLTKFCLRNNYTPVPTVCQYARAVTPLTASRIFCNLQGRRAPHPCR